MERADRLVLAGGKHGSDDKNKLTGAAKDNQDYESKWDRQVRVLKQNFGPASVLAVIATIVATAAAVVAILVAVGGPIVGQAGVNSASAVALDNLKESVKENKEEQAKALADGLGRIEAAVNRSVDLALQNREDLRMVRDEMRANKEGTERRIDKIEQKADANWNWMGQINNRVGQLEAKDPKKEK